MLPNAAGETCLCSLFARSRIFAHGTFADHAVFIHHQYFRNSVAVGLEVKTQIALQGKETRRGLRIERGDETAGGKRQMIAGDRDLNDSDARRAIAACVALQHRDRSVVVLGGGVYGTGPCA